MDSFEMTKIAGAVLAALLLIFGAKTIIGMRAEQTSEAPGYALPGAEPPAEKKKEAAATPGAATKDGAAAPAPKADTKTAEAPKDSAAPAPAKQAAAKDAAPAAPAKEAAAAPAAAAGSEGGEVVALLAKASADNGKAIFSKCKACHVNEKGKTSTVGPNLWGVVNRAKGSYEGYSYSEAMKAKGGNWSFAELAGFIHKPAAYVAGTKMAFAGIAEAADEADVIAYLATLADTPVALPK